MAKLNVVIPSVDVEVDGVKYRKVERKAKSGDIVKALSSEWDITDGAFYAIYLDDCEDLAFLDDVEDERDLDDALRGYKYEVYEKVTEPLATPSAPTKYREVKRKANVGERIKIVAPEFAGGKYGKGTELMVTEVFRGTQGIIDHVKVSTTNKVVLDREYVVLEPVTEMSAPTKPERLKVGEYAKVIAEGTRMASVGDIVKISEDDGSAIPFRIERLDGEYVGWKRERNVVRATDAEVASAKQALERTKAIGEFAEGGYAVVVDASKSHLLDLVNGDYVTVSVVDPEPYSLELTGVNGGWGEFCNADALRKVTKEEYEAATKPAPKFEVGEKVRILRSQCNWPVGTIVTITKFVTADSITATDGHSSYLANVTAIEKISAEEIAKLAEEAKWNAIGRKVGEYKAGDVVAGTRSLEGKERIYGTFIEGPDSAGRIALRAAAGEYRSVYENTAILIAPVESLFNVTTAGGERK